ncbi:hypothetical protein EV356DRAFT_505509 [Viridothelium virens]|uniref:Uncharacterized protein n=1 Tax=Viridothelium virens TaxID=1048519 RepID=A0A6A6H2Q6_VIRVR|nr:hypothetical protein EV356DRAFT_505509 [Viridothelium virens]
MELVDIADMYDCETLATQAIDRELLYAQDSVVDECAREPGDMIGLALALQCEWLYREAATHLLGRSRVAYFEQLGEFFDDHARCLLRRRRNIFVKSLQNAERSLWTIQPKPKDHWSYIAVSFFRQWLSDRIETGEGSRLAPGYARLYHDLAKANCSIKTGISAHLELIGMKSNESNIQTLESNLSTVLKAAAKTIKNDLLPNQARQPTDAKDGYRALTFCSPGHSELPWTVKGEDLCVLAEEYDSMEEISDDDI